MRNFILLMAGGDPTYETPSYANAGGQGNRTTGAYIITVTNTAALLGDGAAPFSELVNGNRNDTTTYFSGGIGVTNKFIRFQFPTLVIINEATWYQGSPSITHGNWKWQGSINGIDWTDIGGSFAFGESPGVETSLAGNTTPYFYYQLLGVSGSTNGGPYINEMEFKIGNPQ